MATATVFTVLYDTPAFRHSDPRPHCNCHPRLPIEPSTQNSVLSTQYSDFRRSLRKGKWTDMDDAFLATLRCPIDPAREATLARDGQQLVCSGCKVKFPVKQG